jgi:hypothetical protein
MILIIFKIINTILYILIKLSFYIDNTIRICSNINMLDIFYKLSIVAIAGSNLFFSFYIFL